MTDIDIQQYQEEFEGGDENYILVDIREDDEYAGGYIPNAINIPMTEFQERYTDEIPEDQRVVLVCATGGRSAHATDFLNAMGYTNVYNLTDGTFGWMMQGLPLETPD